MEMEIDRLLAAVCQSPWETRWPGTLAFLLSAHTLGEVEALVEQIKSPSVFDRLLVTDLECATKVARFLIAFGQTTGSSMIAGLAGLAAGDAARHSGQYQAAMSHHQAAAASFRLLGDQIGWARAQCGWLIAKVHAGRVREDDLAAVEEARRIFTEARLPYRLAVLEQNIGLAYQYLGFSSTALATFEHAFTICPAATPADQHMRACLLGNMGNALLWRGELQRALELHQQAREIFRQLDRISSVANEDFSLCEVERLRWHYREALQAAEEANTGYLRANEHLSAAEALAARAEILLLLNRCEEAVFEAQRAIEIQRSYEKTHIVRVKTLTVLARALTGCGRADEAFHYLEEAAQIATQAGYPRLALPVTLEHAERLLIRGRAVEAREVALSVLRTEACAESALSRVRALLIAAEAALAQGMIEEAQAEARQIAQHQQAQAAPEAPYRAHIILARVAERQGHLTEACAYYDTAFAFLQTALSEFVYDQRTEFLQDKDPLFLAALSTALEAGDAQKALLYLEQGRAFADWAPPIHRGRPGADPLLAELLGQHRALSESLAEAASTDTLRQAAWRIRHYLEAQAQEQPLGPLDGAATLNSTPEGTTLAYALVERDLVIFVLQDGQLTTQWVSDGAEELNDLAWFITLDSTSFPQRLAALSRSQTAPNLAGLESRSRGLLQDLWAMLIEPVQQWLPAKGGKLRLVPHGILHALPLAALYDGSRYLLEGWQVEISPSCQQRPRRSESAHAARPALVLAHDQGGKLPRVEEEAARIGSLLRGDVWTGAEAASERLLQDGPGRRYLHIAAHGKRRMDIPQSSYVSLAGGPLHPSDVLTLDLQGCQLVVLSACETGLGGASGGDAQIGLVRAFGHAGAEAVLATLWPVDDASTCTFMEQFYRHLVAGSSPAAALRQTQGAFLHEESAPLYAHPYFWAGYQLITFVSDGPVHPLTAASVE